jgi:hypothetical protein
VSVAAQHGAIRARRAGMAAALVRGMTRSKLLPLVLVLALPLGVASADTPTRDELARDAGIAIFDARRGYESWFGPDADYDTQAVVDQSNGILLSIARDCSVSVKAALDGGVPADQVIEGRWGPSLGPLSDGEAACEQLRAAAQGAIDAAAAAAEAYLVPYKKALKGDKLELWMYYQEGFYAKGCKPLTEPAALAKAKVWYKILVDDNGLVPQWTTRQYKFKGNKLVVDGKERTGRGSFPPSKGCP